MMTDTQPHTTTPTNINRNAAKIAGLTVIALIAFAWNSIFCRMALLRTDIDPLLFTAIRIVSGAIVLSIIVGINKTRHSATQSISKQPGTGSFTGALALLGYAICFSIAYVSIPSGLGALLLFGAVQFTMITYGVTRGEKLNAQQGIGFIAAVCGLLLLVWPKPNSLTLTPEQIPFAILMLTSGICWGAYSLLAKGSGEPILVTTGNFLRAAAIVCILFPIVAVFPNPFGEIRWDPVGAGFAFLSGAVTSGIGYAIWYQALKHLKSTIAATVQLSVPILVAIFGVLILGEQLTGTLVAAAALILGGVALVIWRSH